jgi:hypothetical protein
MSILAFKDMILTLIIGLLHVWLPDAMVGSRALKK